MSYFAMVVFDIKGGKSEDYTKIYDGLEKLGLKREILFSDKKMRKLPSTTTAGLIRGETVASVKDRLYEDTYAVFAANQLHGEIFILVAGDNAGAHRTV